MSLEYLRFRPENTLVIPPERLWQDTSSLFNPEFVDWLREFPNLAEKPVYAKSLPLENHQLDHTIGNPKDPNKWKISMAADYSTRFVPRAGESVDEFNGRLVFHSSLASLVWSSDKNTREEARELTLELLRLHIPKGMIRQIPGWFIQFSRKTDFTQPTIERGGKSPSQIPSAEELILIQICLSIQPQENGLKLECHWLKMDELSYPILGTVHYRGPFKGANGLRDFPREG